MSVGRLPVVGPNAETVTLWCNVVNVITFRAAVLTLAAVVIVTAQRPQTNWTGQEKPIADQIRTLRTLRNDERATVTRDLALRVRKLNPSPNKLRLAEGLANLSTEGDLGKNTLQEVATTLAFALREEPPEAGAGRIASPYITLAQLARYEHVHVSLQASAFEEAMSRLEAADRRRMKANFTLSDLDGKQWTLSALKGRVVLVNFWATWCPPCRKEMPDLDRLYQEFKSDGLVVLAISDEDEKTVKDFLNGKNFSFPVLLDHHRSVNKTFEIEGIPKSFIYDRKGKLVAESIDMRTREQFLAMLAQAGIAAR